MAEKKQDKTRPGGTEQQSAPRAGGKQRIKMLAMLVAALGIEAAVIVGIFNFAGKPAEVEATDQAQEEAAAGEQWVEELVLAEKFQNIRTGKPYLYDTEIFVIVKRKHQKQVQEDVESMAATLSTEVATVFRRAEPTHLSEPTLATLSRQIKAALEHRLRKDEEGNSVIKEVLVRKCTQLPLY